MTKIAPEQKCEYREALEQAMAGIARLNALFADTGRDYRTRLETYTIFSTDDLRELGDEARANEDNDEDDDIESDADGAVVGSERAEVEDE